MSCKQPSKLRAKSPLAVKVHDFRMKIISETLALQSRWCKSITGAQLLRSSRRAFVLTILVLTLTGQFVSPAYGREAFLPRDHAFLEDLERRSFQYFSDQAAAATG